MRTAYKPEPELVREPSSAALKKSLSPDNAWNVTSIQVGSDQDRINFGWIVLRSFFSRLSVLKLDNLIRSLLIIIRRQST